MKTLSTRGFIVGVVGVLLQFDAPNLYLSIEKLRSEEHPTCTAATAGSMLLPELRALTSNPAVVI